MRYSKLFGKTRKQAPKDEVATNAKLLIRAGFIEKLGAGIYNFLPLGWRVHKKIEQIIREEMDAIGGQELNLAALHPKNNWEKTGRWGKFDSLYKLASRAKEDYALGATHEEIITPIVANFVFSYRDLPLYLYQIQVKFRDEARAKSGLLRCREFVMKDLYSFNATEEERATFYEKVKKAYEKIFKRVGLTTIYTQASGGEFSKTSHEFQVIAENGEDEIIYCPGGDFSANIEISPVREGKQCELGHGPLKREKTIEVGNIFPLGTRFSEAFGAYYTNEKGDKKPIVMGSYGIGVGRLMATIVEVQHDEKGIVWSESVAPFDAHLILIGDKKPATTETHKKNETQKHKFSVSEKFSASVVARKAFEIYGALKKANIEVLFDDREDVSAGEKFADADLIGIPVRLVVSEKTLRQSSGQAGGKIEWKKRVPSSGSAGSGQKTELLGVEEVIRRLK